MIRIYFPNQDRELYCQEGITLAAACETIGFPLDLVCGGKGTCRKCQLEIERYGQTEFVLACQEKVSPDMKIFLHDRIGYANLTALVNHNKIKVEIHPSLEKIHLPREMLSLPFFGGAWEHILGLIGRRIKPPAISLLQKLALLLTIPELQGVTIVLWKDTLLDIEAGNTGDHCYGLAVDLGTTTVVAYLYNLGSGEKMGVYSALNAQISEGADVISRLQVGSKDTQGLQRLQEKVIATINTLIAQACQQCQIDKKQIYSFVICGNSAMQHLFLGLSPYFLGRAPFSAIILSEVVTAAQDLGLHLNPRAVVQFLPLIAGFVGADTAAVLLASQPDDPDELLLIVDLGTNGEIMLGREKRWLVTSTAAGPALEGANISCGMRATDGAVEKVRFSRGNIELQVIGDTAPLGICGSGIIDAVAELHKAGLLTTGGKLLTKDAFLLICKPSDHFLAQYLEVVDDIPRFVLSSGVYLTQKDIRAVQLAKSAISTACSLLLREYGAQKDSLSRILIAGAFGNYINVNNAQYIGLIPAFPGAPVSSIGNAAGAGAEIYLLSQKAEEKTAALLRNVQHVDLSAHPDFQKEFLKNLDLKM